MLPLTHLLSRKQLTPCSLHPFFPSKIQEDFLLLDFLLLISSLTKHVPFVLPYWISPHIVLTVAFEET